MPKHVRALSPLGVTALALLEERPMHPYEMLQLLHQRGKNAVLSIKPGSFYHTVARLAELGLTRVTGVEREGNRPERTLYELTDAGHEAIVRWVRVRLADPTSPQEFAIALAEAHNLGIDEAEEILRRRSGELERQRDETRARLAGAAARGVPLTFMLEHDRRAAMLDADLAWTNSTLARLAATPEAWPDIHSPSFDPSFGALHASGVAIHEETP